MLREKWKLICTHRSLIDLKDFESQIESIVTAFGGRNVIVGSQSFSFEWDDNEMTIGQRATLGRRLAKIKGLGCYVDVYYYTRKGSEKSTVSRQLFRRSTDLD